MTPIGLTRLKMGGPMTIPQYFFVTRRLGKSVNALNSCYRHENNFSNCVPFYSKNFFASELGGL